ncbi:MULTISPECIES: RNA methyltransferase [Olivibacter]|jgi:tRNA G18 (ribose-2'-O)-methylase SpoU|uniref:RNA methyltransferase n=1 Tax=Olivibacter oleidegradans TaxID=760123 RepID=A0ABV6HJD4_9SPHI|nr:MULTISPECIES: RNA methyltransferase [Olivibacter]QEL01823.1 RNA methyltransferase [Olivibacter sp. LS-1]
MRKLSMDELGRPSVDEFKQLDKLPVTVILDSVRSLHNVGSVFRTSDGFAVERILLCGITGTPPHRDIEKTALGATQSVAWQYEKNIEEAIINLKQEGKKIIAIEQAEGSTMLHRFIPVAGESYALIFGNEVNGVSEEAMKLIDYCVEIPQFGTKHSFNVVISAGIVLWDFYRKLKLKSGDS